MKPGNFKKIETLMGQREKLIILENKLKGCLRLATKNIGTNDSPEINLSVNVTGGDYVTTLQEDYKMAISFVDNYIGILQDKIDFINAQLKPL